MANPYTTWVKGVRRTAQQAWTVARSNLAAIGLDYVTSALETIMDLDAADGKLLSTVRAPGISVGAVVDWPSAVYTGTDQNAKNVILVDLDDPLCIWDFEHFMQLIQDTSWHDELGDPPVHGAMWTNEADDSVVWWNRETEAIYAQFDAGASNVFDVSTYEDLCFLDGKIWIAPGLNGGSWCMADLVEDAGYRSQATYLKYASGLSDRNAASGWLNTGITTKGSASTATGYTVNAIRHESEVDEHGRPKHWLQNGTASGVSVENPVDGNVYDATTDATQIDATALSAASQWLVENQGVEILTQMSLIQSFDADQSGRMHAYNATAVEVAIPDGTMNSLAILPGASLAEEGNDALLVGYDTGGMIILHATSFDNDIEGLIRLHEDYASPYMKGRAHAWPLHAVTDVSSHGDNLTNNNSVTFSSGGPTGNYGTFDGVNQCLSKADGTWTGHEPLTSADATTVEFWMYISAYGAGDTVMVSKWDDSLGNSAFIAYISSAGVLTVMARLGAVNRTLNGPTLSLATWYHIAFTNDAPGESLSKLYVNREHVDSTSSGGDHSGNDNPDFVIGAVADGAGGFTKYFNGHIAGVSEQSLSTGAFRTPFSQREIGAEYVRGQRSLNSGIDTNDTISDNDIAALAVDPHGKYFAVAYDNKNVDIFSSLAVPVLRDAYPGTTLRDVAIKSMPGGKDPHYIMAGSDQIEFVQPDTEILTA